MESTLTLRAVTREDIPALVRLRLATRIETYRDIYPAEWIDKFDIAASQERFLKIADDPQQNLYFSSRMENVSDIFAMAESRKKPCRKTRFASTCYIC